MTVKHTIFGVQIWLPEYNNKVCKYYNNNRNSSEVMPELYLVPFEQLNEINSIKQLISLFPHKQTLEPKTRRDMLAHI